MEFRFLHGLHPSHGFHAAPKHLGYLLECWNISFIKFFEQKISFFIKINPFKPWKDQLSHIWLNQSPKLFRFFVSDRISRFCSPTFLFWRIYFAFPFMTEPIAWFAHLEKKNMNFKIFSFTNVQFRITQKTLL